MGQGRRGVGALAEAKDRMGCVVSNGPDLAPSAAPERTARKQAGAPPSPSWPPRSYTCSSVASSRSFLPSLAVGRSIRMHNSQRAGRERAGQRAQAAVSLPAPSSVVWPLRHPEAHSGYPASSPTAAASSLTLAGVEAPQPIARSGARTGGSCRRRRWRQRAASAWLLTATLLMPCAGRCELAVQQPGTAGASGASDSKFGGVWGLRVGQCDVGERWQCAKRRWDGEASDLRTSASCDSFGSIL